jgi:hypothetical protein
MLITYFISMLHLWYYFRYHSNHKWILTSSQLSSNFCDLFRLHDFIIRHHMIELCLITFRTFGCKVIQNETKEKVMKVDFTACLFAHIYIHIYIYVCMHVCMHAYIRTYTHTYAHIYTHTYIHTGMHAYIRRYVRTYVHAYIHTYTYIHLHTYIHIHIHT